MSNSLLNMSHMLVITFGICIMLSNLFNKVIFLKKKKKLYTNFIRAQLSNDELRLLFYNCLSKRGTKFKKFVEKYALLEDVSSLINEEHRDLYKKSAFGESV